MERDDLQTATQLRWPDQPEHLAIAEPHTPSEPPDVEILHEWLPSDPARSIEAIVIAIFFVGGWLLALWAYSRLT